MFLGDLVQRITCQPLTNDRIVRCIIAYQFCIDDCVSVIFVLCFDNFVSCFGNFMLCLDNIVLCLDNIVFCFDHFVLCLDNIVLCFDNLVLCLDKIVLCFDNFVLCFKNIVLCFKNCLLCLQIWATVIYPCSKISSTTKPKLLLKSLDISKQSSTVFRRIG